MNRYIILSLLLSFLIGISCHPERPPRDILRKEQLVPLLMDLHMVYAVQSSVEFRKIAVQVDSVDAYSYIFDKHGVPKVVFDSTIAWYSRHPEQFTKVYDEVVMNLTQIQDSIKMNLKQ